MVFDRRPTCRYIRVLRRVFQVIELQAFLRVVAQSRTDFDRDRILVFPRLYALHHWLQAPQCSSCIFDALESTTNSRSSSIFEVGAGITLASIGL